MNDYRNTVHNVLALYRWAHGPETNTVVYMDWTSTMTQRQAREFLRAGLMIRCNRGLPMRGRKFDDGYQLRLWRSAEFLKAFARQASLGGLQWALNRQQPFQSPDVSARLPHIVAAWRERN
jgi:hypothetical protein